jgi:hypothetical protein
MKRSSQDSTGHKAVQIKKILESNSGGRPLMAACTFVDLVGPTWLSIHTWLVLLASLRGWKYPGSESEDSEELDDDGHFIRYRTVNCCDQLLSLRRCELQIEYYVDVGVK